MFYTIWPWVKEHRKKAKKFQCSYFKELPFCGLKTQFLKKTFETIVVSHVLYSKVPSDLPGDAVSPDIVRQTDDISLIIFRYTWL